MNDKEDDNIFKTLDDIDKKMTEKAEMMQANKEKLTKKDIWELGEEYGFDKYINKGEKKYMTFMMFQALGMYEKVMTDYDIHSISDLRKRLDKLNEYESREDRV